MAKYVFISNSTKPNEKEYSSLEPIKLTNVSSSCLKAAKSLGYEIIQGVNRKYPEKLKCEEMDIKFYDSNTYRSLLAIKDNLKAYKNLCKVLKEGDVEVIHCNTPIGGLIGRVCGRKYNVPKIIYTAHGFHFYKGAPLFNNTILKLAEHIMAKWTDIIITMNEEDYQAAKKMKLRNGGHVYKVNGVGVKVEDYQNVKVNKVKKRKELGLSENDYVLIGMGDLIKRKNYKMAIEAISKCNNPRIHYLICGQGPELDNLIKLSKKLNISKQIHFLGFRNDIKELLKISDCFLFTSLQEGLPRSLMEAMASGLPCIVSNIRGNNDLIKDNDLLIESVEECSTQINRLMNSLDYRKKNETENINIIKEYNVSVVNEQIHSIYINNL